MLTPFSQRLDRTGLGDLCKFLQTFWQIVHHEKRNIAQSNYYLDFFTQNLQINTVAWKINIIAWMIILWNLVKSVTISLTFSTKMCLNVSSPIAWWSLLLAWLRNQLKQSSEQCVSVARLFHSVSTCSRLSPRQRYGLQVYFNKWIRSVTWDTHLACRTCTMHLMWS